ncbi:MAG TPA: DUF805 domain-containing protein [Nocardioides sp.]|jgi:uncharacterized membrane protein YhaH (DUF805 family)|uniref:DUF805 domain-containing protein n=1 Tax=Nocardioides sp. TaxID=35761 RepID=UPI002E2F0D2B|nr:DUF805 domain-containing protein [Nocardioides sp.]HEX3929539.1 DUF805 domain-containing protein [Nocardioides sp.]
MSFQDAVKICISKYADFNGRARRSEYWWWVLFTVIVSFVASIIDVILGTRSGSFGLIEGLATLAFIVPSLAVGARRLHDVGMTGWLQLLAIIPIIGALILIFAFYIRDSQPDNKYGPSPKGYGAGPGAPGGPGYGQPPQAPSGPDYGQPPGPPSGQNPYGT